MTDLPAARAEAVERVTVLRAQHADFVAASLDTNADDEHDVEGATIAYERQQVAALLQTAERRLSEIDAAIERAAAGAYGTCERCGEPIDPERLAVRPDARRCVPCARLN